MFQHRYVLEMQSLVRQEEQGMTVKETWRA